ncbi:hypothetical protein PoB_007182300 [Plakobranchus ocellatus]|uniref:Uncharacterized protein n=1 Tax=Plakobranchus ocellatus TaxID=259542 RepID=A0AAV4DLW5_9GAST|nr:hypothetical protein PoB_007182300 [Plakobranchus ocellatus]
MGAEKTISSIWGNSSTPSSPRASIFPRRRNRKAHEENENVDKLAKAALNKASSSEKLICWSDLKPKVNAYMLTIWQENWDVEMANKLRDVLPNLGEDLSKKGEGAGRNGRQQ